VAGDVGRSEETGVICRIRPYREADASGLYDAVRESIAEVSRWLPWCHPDYSMQEAIEWATLQARLAAGGGPEVGFAVVGPNDEFLGGCGVNQVNPIHRFGNLGYWVRTSATGRGVAREAARQTAELAFRNTDLVRLEIVCAVENRRSQRVAGAVGATREGVLRNRLRIRDQSFDAVMYSLVRPNAT
jgi:RimJ/RimL family protein N-acetyltransferase